MPPKNKEELKKIIEKEIELNGKKCNLNHINVSEIEDMSHLFQRSEFNGDISKWDVSSVKNMREMFAESKFNGDISKWEVSKVENMSYMFADANFNDDISKWNVSKVKSIEGMFYNSEFKGDLNKWKIINLKNKKEIFKNSQLEKEGKEPYWSSMPIESIKETIESYSLHKELNEILSNEITINKPRKKI